MNKDPRWGRLTRWMTRGAPGAFCLFWLLFWIISRNPAFSLTAAGLVAGTALATVVTIALTVWTRRPASAGRLRLIIAMFGLQVGLAAALLLIAFGVPFPWAAAAGAGVGGAMAAYYGRGKHAAQLRGLLNQFPVDIDTREEARNATRCAVSCPPIGCACLANPSTSAPRLPSGMRRPDTRAKP